MAAITPTKYERATNAKRDTSIEQWFGTSASNSSDTMVVPGGTVTTRPKRLVSVTVKYGGAASVTVTVTHNYLGLGGGAGTTYDVLLDSTALSAQTDYVFIPPGEWFLNGGDTVTVSVPAVVGQTSRVVVTLEVI